MASSRMRFLFSTALARCIGVMELPIHRMNTNLLRFSALSSPPATQPRVRPGLVNTAHKDGTWRRRDAVNTPHRGSQIAKENVALAKLVHKVVGSAVSRRDNS